jgi:hypothetical protein
MRREARRADDGSARLGGPGRSRRSIAVGADGLAVFLRPKCPPRAHCDRTFDEADATVAHRHVNPARVIARGVVVTIPGDTAPRAIQATVSPGVDKGVWRHDRIEAREARRSIGPTPTSVFAAGEALLGVEQSRASLKVGQDASLVAVGVQNQGGKTTAAGYTIAPPRAVDVVTDQSLGKPDRVRRAIGDVLDAVGNPVGKDSSGGSRLERGSRRPHAAEIIVVIGSRA